jgi:outer membrane protein assembly factor BamB
MERLKRTEENSTACSSCVLKLYNVVLLLSLVISQACNATDWPQWRGPNHTDVTSEKSGWPKGWPPKRLWKKNGGCGCTSPILADGRLYVMGWKGRRRRGNPVGTDTVYCFDVATGNILWKRSYRCRYQGRFRTGDTSRYGGPTSTPTFDAESGCLYTPSIDSDLRCWNTKKAGRPVWSVNLYERYKVRRRPKVEAGTRDYGYSCSPAVLGNAVITEVGGRAGTLVAFDKKTGNDNLLVLGSRDLGLVDISCDNKKHRELAYVKDVISGACYPHLALADGIVAVKNKEGDVVCLSVRPRLNEIINIGDGSK